MSEVVKAKLKLWKADPVQFVRDNFHVEPDAWQARALGVFANQSDYFRIALRACSGPGKSTVLAWCALNFLVCYGGNGDYPKGVAISITLDNLKTGLWAELSFWMNKSKFIAHFFTWTQTKIFAKERPDVWWLAARSFPAGSDTETIGKTLSGLHAKYLLYIIDESGAIPAAIVKTAEQGLGETLARPGGFAKIVTAGNPITTDGLLYAVANLKDWHNIKITSDPLDPNRTPRVDKTWAQLQIDTHGRNDPWVQSYILGDFPDTAINSLLSLKEVEDAMSRHLLETDYNYSQKRLGVDVARGGLDSTVIFPRQGLAAFKYTKMHGAMGNEVAARVLQAKAKWGSEIEFIDDTGGFGSSVIDSLTIAGQSPFGVHFSSKALSARYFNKRAEMWLEMSAWVKRGGALPQCNQLKKELTSVQYYLRNGKFALEEKDQIKKRLGFSPDIADALALTFAIPDQPKRDEFEYLRHDSNKLVSEYDPF
jgi:hypothetical protein